jgi:hypothetical protein
MREILAIIATSLVWMAACAPQPQLPQSQDADGIVLRDSRGRIARSQTAKREFERANPCPSTRKRSGACAGYVIDHIIPLSCGGADAPANMQWQTVADAKAKDRWELSGPGCPQRAAR